MVLSKVLTRSLHALSTKGVLLFLYLTIRNNFGSQNTPCVTLGQLHCLAGVCLALLNRAGSAGRRYLWVRAHTSPLCTRAPGYPLGPELLPREMPLLRSDCAAQPCTQTALAASRVGMTNSCSQRSYQGLWRLRGKFLLKLVM